MEVYGTWYSDEELIATFTRRSRVLWRMTMKPSSRPVRHTSFDRPVASAASEPFDNLPAEISFQILESLDVLSLTRLASASLRMRCLVESLDSYQAMLRQTPAVLTALGETRTAHLHSVGQLHATLTGIKCRSCGDIGPLFCLMTCERACYICSSDNTALLVVDPETAKDTFQLSDQHIQQLPFFRQPRSCLPFQGQERKSFVCVSHAKRLALQLHGSVDAIRAHYSDGLHWVQRDQREARLNARFGPLTRAMGVEMPSSGGRNWARDTGMGAIVAPFINAGAAFHGPVWCRGCLKAGHDFALRRRTDELYVLDPPPDAGVMDWWAWTKTRAYTFDLLKQHLTKCRVIALWCSVLDRGDDPFSGWESSDGEPR